MKNVVCRPEIGKARVAVMFGKIDSVMVSVPLLRQWFHDVLRE